MNYMVAGYANNFQGLQLFELGIEYADGKRLQYLDLAPIRHETKNEWAIGQPKDVYFGEHAFLFAP